MPGSDCRQRSLLHPINREAGFVRNRWPLSIGLGGRFPSESVAALARIPQAAIWMAARHFYSKHRGSLWVSTVDITEAASKPTDHMLSLALPAGSGGLTVEHMVRALRAIGREPLLYHGSYDAKNGQITWPTSIAPTAVIDRYVDSGIPVIVGLAPWAGQSELHAVVAVGHALHELNPGKSLPNDPTRSEWVRFLVVNDDQRGTSLRLPVASSDPLSETPYDVSHIVYIIVPLPGKVFTPAEAAEKIGWDMIRRYQAEWPILKTTYATQMAGATNAGDQFTDQIAQNQVVARTYLTYGWRYKQRMVRNTCSDTLKNAVFQHDFPRFVWVTEFGTRASLNHLDETQIRIFAHSVVDATSSRFWEGRCIFHAPGFVWRWYHDLNNPFADYVNSITPIATEMPYGMKIRGSYPGQGP